MAKEPKKTKKAPRKFTKEYQGGRKRLKDVDKSGKRDFGDTFLGDLLGMDKGNKLGVQGAGLIKSLKGVRREEPKKDKPKKYKSVIQKTGSGLLPPPPPESKITTTKLPPKRKLGPPGTARPKPAAKPEPTTAEKKRLAFKKFTSKQWEDMSVDERRRNNLPPTLTSLTAGKYREFKFKDGTSPLDLKRQLKRGGRFLGFDMNKGGSVSKKSGYTEGGSVTGKKPMVMKAGKKVPAYAADGVGKMNKGGMTAAKKKPAVKKMMAGGMAKKSGYMYGGMAKKKK